jgi:hypothetical protein
MPPVRRRRRWLVLVAALVVTAAAAVFVTRPGPPTIRPICRATAAQSSFDLDLEQAANATTIAAVGKRLGLPDHAVTVAIAAALQESGLHNLDHGDLDSLGLFQQRPSQGWGTTTQIMTPHYAAAAFYQRLQQLSGWETLSVTDAAQGVQHSAAPNAYAQWEAEARVLAQAMTGETAAGLTCQYQPSNGRGPSAALSAAIAVEVGAPNRDVPVATARGWTVAAWIVGHAQRYDVATVTFAGQRWTAASGAWRADPSADATVRAS